MIKDITTEEFKEEIFNYETDQQVNNDRLTVVDFWAGFCSPCKKLSPILEEIATEHPEIDIVKVNVEIEHELSTQFNIRGVPTLVFLKNGEVVKTLVGLYDKKEIIANLV